MGILTRFAERPPAKLVLADGTVFEGYAVGAMGEAVAEVVFNTAMTGYQEILTDPSYAEQIVTLTCPHIGNVGVNPGDEESSRVWVKGLLIRESSLLASNWRATQTLSDYLRAHQVVAVAGIDARQLTRHIQATGVQVGCLLAGEACHMSIEEAQHKAQNTAGLEGVNLAVRVSATKQKTWSQGLCGWGFQDVPRALEPLHVVVYDWGVKYNILRSLVARGCRVTVVPADTAFADVQAMQPDGVLLSNGPGDPAACHDLIQIAAQCVAQRIPTLGICLGYQILALAMGATTFKMKLGHHGANHPIQDLACKQGFITSQNHGFAVAIDSLPACLVPTYRSLFDGTLQGFCHKDAPMMGVQGHPEASPGPSEAHVVFDQFLNLMRPNYA